MRNSFGRPPLDIEGRNFFRLRTPKNSAKYQIHFFSQQIPPTVRSLSHLPKLSAIGGVLNTLDLDYLTVKDKHSSAW